MVAQIICKLLRPTEGREISLKHKIFGEIENPKKKNENRVEQRERERKMEKSNKKIQGVDRIDNPDECSVQLTKLFTHVATHVAGFFLVYILCHLSHYLLRPYSQPRITSDTFVGLVIGNIGFIRGFLSNTSQKILHNLVDFGMIGYMFVLGIEMDPYVLFKVPTKDAKVAYAGMLITFILACAITPFLYYTEGFKIDFTLSLSMVLSSTASPVLTRMITSLKIGKSDIGQLVIATGMHSDFIATLLLSIGFVIWPVEVNNGTRSLERSLEMGTALLIQTIFTAFVSPIFMNWVNNENPEGKPMKGSHLVLSMAFMAFAVACPSYWGYSTILSAFMAGIFLPREGRVSKWVIGKINYLLSTIFYPIFFFWMGYEAYFAEFQPLDWMTWARLFVIFAIATIGKVVGTVISGALLGFNWPESVALGLLLTTKGHFHIYLAISAKLLEKTSTSTSTVMVIAIFFTIVHAPSVVAQIIKRARRRAPTHRMSLQLLDPSSELRILLCLHGPQNVRTAINFIEISRGTPDPGIVVFVTDMIELTDQIAATLVKEAGVNTMTVTDEEVTEMRDQVTTAVQSYVDDNENGITLGRLLALSTFNGMPQDICILAEDSTVALIILPFHKTRSADGTLDGGHSGFRFVNRKVLKNAPCSVGILVDRGFGLIEKISRSYDHTIDMAVIFIGGKDDREALAYADHVARHPGVKLTILRFLVDTSSDASSRPGHYHISRALQEEEMKLDDECFAKFYERHVACGQVSYSEKHLANSSETYNTLMALDGQYSLIIVGRGERVNTVLTFGMNDWQQCPELGPIGDVLAGSEFSVKTSVLIIQQNSVKGELDGLDDNFSVM
ncbi:LOW QUALITY PROTEIN: cation/H(+) antiporter 28 [Argentina anserina]|uniref:LOW QUALITY PROTEIN: cation/H(+) antiporter 28 n=1 Tax=Argentina anserina TaxID=57926 RepID=UPI0021766579|nr:LOW QUALITY PROTEIN: cation/H(+) antiporter 28 [Potentilla anserina]